MNNYKNEKSWDMHAKRYFDENVLSCDCVDFCGNLYRTEEDLKLIGDVKGLKILELGAGSCNCGIALAKEGADVVCTDISKEQLYIGNKQAEKCCVNIKTVQCDMENLDDFTDEEFDLVISICSLMYVENIQKVFKEVSRVLKKGGKFVFSTNHPIVMSVGATDLWPEEKADPNYNYRGKVEWKWFEEDNFYFTTYRRPIMDYVNFLSDNRFVIKKMHEEYPIKIDKEWSQEEKDIRERYPSLLVVLAEKL